MDRIVREKVIEFFQFVLANAAVAEKGHMACLDTSSGQVTPGAESTTLLPIGTFTETLTGDGEKLVNVHFFTEIRATWWENDTDSPVAASDVGNECYILDSETVSMDGTSRSVGGRVIAVDAGKGVLVQAGSAVMGPTGSAPTLGETSVADMTALKAIAAGDRFNGRLVLVRANGSMWRFAESSTASDTSEQLVATPAAGDGRWLRADKAFAMALPVGTGTADNATLHEVPDGFELKLAAHPFWDVTTDFTGGTDSAIGVATDKTGYDTDGDLLGGASGDVAADLDAGVHPGTLGGKLETVAHLAGLVLEAGDKIVFNRITDHFAAGAGFVRVPVIVCVAPASA